MGLCLKHLVPNSDYHRSWVEGHTLSLIFASPIDQNYVRSRLTAKNKSIFIWWSNMQVSKPINGDKVLMPRKESHVLNFVVSRFPSPTAADRLALLWVRHGHTALPLAQRQLLPLLRGLHVPSSCWFLQKLASLVTLPAASLLIVNLVSTIQLVKQKAWGILRVAWRDLPLF